MQTCTVRAWDVKKPLLFCPAMNTFMWEHPITASQVEQLINMGYTQIAPIKKTLACGDTGKMLCVVIVACICEVWFEATKTKVKYICLYMKDPWFSSFAVDNLISDYH